MSGKIVEQLITNNTRTLPSEPFGIAQFDFKPTDGGQLGFKKGDVLIISGNN